VRSFNPDIVFGLIIILPGAYIVLLSLGYFGFDEDSLHAPRFVLMLTAMKRGISR
jgi:hypothetical protein